MLKNFKKSNTYPERSKVQVSTVKCGLKDLKEEIEEMIEQEKEIEKPNEQ